MKKKQIHYIWVHWYSSTGSSHSKLINNKSVDYGFAVRIIKRMDAKCLYMDRPDWLKDCTRITVSAQNIMDRNIYYKRVINITKQ